MVFNGKNFVKATQVVELVQSTLIDLFGKFFTSHLIPEKGALLVHFLELPIANDPVQILLSIGFSHSQDLESVFDDCLLNLIV